jgi:hypothetical protein
MAQCIRFQNEKDIVRASRTVVEEGLLPHRIVLRDLGGEFVVHAETLDVGVRENTVYFTHYSYEHGDYFPYNKDEGVKMYAFSREAALEAADKCFVKRAATL